MKGDSVFQRADMIRKAILILLSFAVLSATGATDTIIYISGIIRDQSPNTMPLGSHGTANNSQGFWNTDFQWQLGAESGIVGPVCNAANGWQPPACGALAADNTPTYAWPGRSNNGVGSVHSPASFNTWFHNSNYTVNIPVNITLYLQSSGVYQTQYTDNYFFPIDGKGWGDYSTGEDNKNHNFAFCIEAHSRFGYSGGEVFTFAGDDDVYVFLDGRLMVDLGGVHTTETGTITLSDIPDFVVGNTYRFDMFYCERHTVSSDLLATTSLQFYCAYYDWCGVCEGNGQSCCTAALISEYCNDNNPCTVDTCPVTNSPTQGNCTHTLISCPAPTACQTQTCSAAGACVYSNISCNDNNVCTVDTCNPVSGCLHTTLSCNDNAACTVDTCNPVSGCLHTTLNCNDNTACTLDSCSNSTGCINSPINCNDGNACTTDTCNPSTGCAYASVNCNDGNECTTDSCNTTTGCQNIAKNCNLGSKCSTDTCDPDTGCVHTPVTCESTSCLTGSCNNASGCSYSPVLCYNGTTCTSSACVATVGCPFTGISCNGTPACNSAADCNDYNACTVDSCAGGNCTHTPVVCANATSCNPQTCSLSTGLCVDNFVVCNDNNPCTVDQCNLGTCSFTPLACNTSDPCNPYVCSNGVCVVETPTCDDDNLCTTDTCSNVQGHATCVFTAVQCPGTGCSPSACNSTTGTCQATPVICTDNNPCTDDTPVCTNNTITCNATINNLCDDHNTCTNDYCSSTATEPCSYTNVTCAAPNTCQIFTGCNATTGCTYAPKVCPQSTNLCLNSTCDPIAGCIQNQVVCIVNDVNCFTGSCSATTGICTKSKKSNFNTAISSNGISCLLRYDQKAAVAIGTGAAVGIALGAAAAVGLFGYGGKKGYDLYQARNAHKDTSVMNNPLYEQSGNQGDNPLWEAKSGN